MFGVDSVSWWSVVPFYCGGFSQGGGVGQLACQGFLVREAWVGVLLCGTGFVLSGVQWSVQ